MTGEPLPWQAAAWRQLRQARIDGRLPHALLLHGRGGLGKHSFAYAFGQWLLCEQPGDAACGQCKRCRQFAAGSSPDFFVLAPPEDKKIINVEQVRDLIDTLSLTSHAGGGRVALIDPADAMNVSAANSLLKTLEEPPGDTVLLLVSARPARLPATVRSRCQHVRFAPPPEAAALAWLEEQGLDAAMARKSLALAAGRPLTALALGRDGGIQRREAVIAGVRGIVSGDKNPVAVAETLGKEPLAETLEILSGWAAAEIRRTRGDAGSRALFATLDRLYAAEKLRDTPVSPQLLLEGLLIPLAPAPRKRTGY